MVKELALIFSCRMKNKLTTILLVDDDEISNYITESLIAELDIAQSLAIVTDGKQALDFIQSHPIIKEETAGHILVLLDLNMPVMDGFEFMEVYQQKTTWSDKVSIVMLTSSNNPKDMNKAKSFHFAGYLQKPFKQNDILQLILSQNFN